MARISLPFLDRKTRGGSLRSQAEQFAAMFLSDHLPRGTKIEIEADDRADGVLFRIARPYDPVFQNIAIDKKDLVNLNSTDMAKMIIGFLPDPKPSKQIILKDLMNDLERDESAKDRIVRNVDHLLDQPRDRDNNAVISSSFAMSSFPFVSPQVQERIARAAAGEIDRALTEKMRRSGRAFSRGARDPR